MRKSRRKRRDRAGSSPMRGKSRRKRAYLGRRENDRDSFLYLGYEAPTIYDSFEQLDTKLTGKKKKRKRELPDKGSAAVENDRTLDSLPIKGKNRLEDEVILLNKREAWKRENEKQLEEVAFGKDMRNGTQRERERFEKLTGGDKRRPIDEISSRTKREDVCIRGTLAIPNADRSSNSHAASEIGNDEAGKNSTSGEISKGRNATSGEDRLRSVERRINVFADNNGTDRAAIDTAIAGVSVRGELPMNATSDNFAARNCDAKIDKANGSAGLAERRSTPEAAREADDDNNAVKLNRTTNHRSEETSRNPEVGLKNLRQWRERGIYGVADWKTSDLFYGDDDNLPRNKLRGKYVAKLDEADDLDTDPENNLVLLRLRSKKRPSDVVEWKLVPVARRSPSRDARTSRIFSLTEKRVPLLSSDRNGNVAIGSSSSNPKLWRLKYRGRRKGAFNILPVLGMIDDGDSSSLVIPPKAGRAIEITGLKYYPLLVNPKAHFRRSREPSRRRSNKRSSGGRVAEFRVPSAWRDLNRELRNLPSRSRDDPELGNQAIYDVEAGPRLPISPYHYYVDFADLIPTTFHFVPDTPGRAGDTYRYPARAYLEYGPFKERARDSERRVARLDDFRQESWKEITGFPGDNLANNSSGKFSVETDDESTRANRRGDHPASIEARCAPGTIRENKTTTARLGNL